MSNSTSVTGSADGFSPVAISPVCLLLSEKSGLEYDGHCANQIQLTAVSAVLQSMDPVLLG